MSDEDEEECVCRQYLYLALLHPRLVSRIWLMDDSAWAFGLGRGHGERLLDGE